MHVAIPLLVILVVLGALLALAWRLMRPTPDMLDLPEMAEPGPDPGVETTAGADDAADDALVTLARYHFQEQANLLRGRLLADGIPAFVTNAHTTQALGYLRLAHGGVRVMVPAAREAAAREVIQALDSGQYCLDDDDALDETDRSR